MSNLFPVLDTFYLLQDVLLVLSFLATFDTFYIDILSRCENFIVPTAMHSKYQSFSAFLDAL